MRWRGFPLAAGGLLESAERTTSWKCCTNVSRDSGHPVFGCRTARPDSANSGSEFLFLYLQCTALVADGGSGQGELPGLSSEDSNTVSASQICLSWPPTVLLRFDRPEEIGFFFSDLLGPVLLF